MQFFKKDEYPPSQTVYYSTPNGPQPQVYYTTPSGSPHQVYYSTPNGPQEMQYTAPGQVPPTGWYLVGTSHVPRQDMTQPQMPDSEINNIGLSTDSIRRAFIRKVYLILLVRIFQRSEMNIINICVLPFARHNCC